VFLDSPHAYHAKYISTPQKHRRKNRKPFFTARVYHLFTIPACWVLWMHLEYSKNQIHNKPQVYSLDSQTIIGWKETRPVPWTAILLLRVSPWRRVIGPSHWTSSIRSLMHGCHSKIEMLTFDSFTEQSELLSSLNRGSVVNNWKEQMMMKHRENLQDSCRSKDSYMTLFWFFFSFHWVKAFDLGGNMLRKEGEWWNNRYHFTQEIVTSFGWQS
jgi:hypothetical protein